MPRLPPDCFCAMATGIAFIIDSERTHSCVNSRGWFGSVQTTSFYDKYHSCFCAAVALRGRSSHKTVGKSPFVAIIRVFTHVLGYGFAEPSSILSDKSLPWRHRYIAWRAYCEIIFRYHMWVSYNISFTALF